MITSVQAADAALTLKPSYLESPRLRSYKNGKFPLEWAAGMADTMTDQMSQSRISNSFFMNNLMVTAFITMTEKHKILKFFNIQKTIKLCSVEFWC